MTTKLERQHECVLRVPKMALELFVHWCCELHVKQIAQQPEYFIFADKMLFTNWNFPLQNVTQIFNLVRLPTLLNKFPWKPLFFSGKDYFSLTECDGTLSCLKIIYFLKTLSFFLKYGTTYTFKIQIWTIILT